MADIATEMITEQKVEYKMSHRISKMMPCFCCFFISVL
jgi:hypothetical protein